MMNNPIDIASLRERIDVVQVISRYLHLQKQGAGYVGLCPFHEDRHPSLQVSPAKGLYHCFSCGAGGDAFGFVQKREGCGFGEAVRICADICHAGYIPQQQEIRQPETKKEKRPKGEPTVAGNERFWATLLPYDPGCEGLKDTYARFGVRMGVNATSYLYRFTQDRLVFPIRDAAGQLVAFAARYVGTDQEVLKQRKYMNSKTSSIYKKDSLLYAWHEAEEAIRESGQVFITEGYKDALAMHAAGFSQAVALCGVSLSACHLSLICGAADTVFLLLDGDTVGRNVAAKLVPLFRKSGLQVVDLVPEGGKDPDEMFRRMGREPFAAWIRRAMVSPARLEAGALLSAACRRWPEGVTEECTPENMPEILQVEDLQSSAARFAELDRLYGQHTEPSHAEAVRQGELIRYLCLCYREVCLEADIRQDSRRLSLASGEAARAACFAALQRHRLELRDVSRALHRRG